MSTTDRRRTREAARVRRSGRRGAAALTGLVAGLGLVAVAADLAVVAARGSGAVAASVPVVGGLRPVDPAAAGRALAGLPASAVPAWTTAGLLALAGLALLALAVRPGGSRRRVLAPATGPVVADRGVVADALAEVAARAARLPGSQVSVRLRRRAADVVVRPLNGAPVPVAQVEQALAPAIEQWGLVRSRAGGGRPLPVRVAVAEHGTVAS